MYYGGYYTVSVISEFVHLNHFEYIIPPDYYIRNYTKATDYIHGVWAVWYVYQRFAVTLASPEDIRKFEEL